MRCYPPDPAGRANSAPPDLLVGFGGKEIKGKRGEGKGKKGREGKKWKGKGSEREKDGRNGGAKGREGRGRERVDNCAKL